MGVAAFSTSPMLVMPLTDHRAATKAAIDAVDRPGLDYTNIGRGLAMALSMFKADASDRSRAILLVSDGAGVIDPRIQDDLRAEFKKTNVHLYWLFLRTAGSPGIYELPEADRTRRRPRRNVISISFSNRSASPIALSRPRDPRRYRRRSIRSINSSVTPCILWKTNRERIYPLRSSPSHPSPFCCFSPPS